VVPASPRTLRLHQRRGRHGIRRPLLRPTVGVAMARDLKTFLGRALLVVNVATAVLAACWWLAVYVAPASMSIPAHGDTGTLRIAVRESGTTDLVALFAALLLVANFLWLVYGGTERAPSPYVLSETPEGKVKVSREAVEA